MNRSVYSRFVGDIFGAPLDIEGLLAFFLESTFLGLWIFGWYRLPRRVHLACIWLASIGTILSAYFILAVTNAASTPYTLKIMTWVAVVFTPGGAMRPRGTLVALAAVVAARAVLAWA
jgi:cytochrome d ubiquinol oxidase subunit I